MATERQILANRRNSSLSTGPRTPEGRDASRGNALTHGMTASVVLPEDESQKVAQRLVDWHETLKPQGLHQEWLAEQAVVASVRIDHCQQFDRALRIRSACRASTCWDDDRRLAVEKLVAGLSRRPALVARELGQTPQGCDWLIGRWNDLADAIEEAGPLDDDGRRLAFDLLGLHPERRIGRTPLDPPPGGDAKAHQASLAGAQVALLERRKAENVLDLDELDREAAELGLAVEVDPMIRLARRYEADNRRQMRSAMAELRQKQESEAFMNLSPFGSSGGTGRPLFSEPADDLGGTRDPAPPPAPEPSPEPPDAPAIAPPAAIEAPVLRISKPAPAPPARISSAPTNLAGRPFSMATTVLSPPPANRQERRSRECQDRRA